MTPAHPLWDEFCEILAGPEYCDFREENEMVWTCAGDLTLSEKLLSEWYDVDVPGSLQFFREHGGYCDCEVLFNVAASHRN